VDLNLRVLRCLTYESVATHDIHNLYVNINLNFWVVYTSFYSRSDISIKILEDL